MSKRVCGLVVVLGLGCALLTRPGGGAERVGPAAGGSAGTGLDALDWPRRIALERLVAEGDAAHQPRTESAAPTLGDARFDERGVHVAADRGAVDVVIALAAIGRAGAMRELGAAPPATLVGPEVHIARAPGVLEWWRSLPSGLEQGVTIDARPAGAGVLRLEMTTGADVTPELASADEVVLRSASGAPVARYAHLVVLDAAGARVPARLAVAAGRIAIDVDDAAARYPLVVDPLVITELATLSVAGAGTGFGTSVAVSADGTRALVGSFTGVTATGLSARIFFHDGTTWALEQILTTPTTTAGESVSLSADGTRALIGNPFARRAYVHRRVPTGTTWSLEGTLLPADPSSSAEFAASVALTGGGGRAIVGAPWRGGPPSTVVGSAHVFRFMAGTWSHEAELLAPDGNQSDDFGASVALAASNHAIVGAPNDNTSAGASSGSAHVFFRAGTGTIWAHEATLLSSSAASGDRFGSTVALSVDVSRAVVSAPVNDFTAPRVGRVHVFLRTGVAWAEEATLLAPDGAVTDSFGASCALNDNGSRLFVGAPGDNTIAGVRTGSVRVFLRAGTSWTEAGSLLATGAQDNDWLGGAVAVTSDGSVALAGAMRDTVAGTINGGSVRVFSVARAPDGSACGSNPTCSSNLCVDGVCCATACAGGTSDCRACSVAAGGITDGRCTALTAAAAAATTCRAAAGDCDVAEVCRSTSATCPADAPAGAGTLCRAAADDCDVAETCSGTSVMCPTDAFAPATTMCRSSAGGCDAADFCVGWSPVCPPNAPAARDTVCNASLGPCDPAELCDGTSFACPANQLTPNGIACGMGLPGTCSGPGTCDGMDAACPGASILPAGTLCTPAMAGNPCDVDDRCDGMSGACPTTYAPATTACGAVATGDCDAPDHCSGTSADCVAELRSGVECRASMGACDVPEICAGDTTCPPQDVLPADAPCRTSTDLSCDPEEVCDGVAPTCPADVNACVLDAGTPDAGAPDASGELDAAVRVDAGAAPDAPPGIDAGPPPVAAEGCSCRAGASSHAPGGLALGLVLATVALRRRRGRRSPTRGPRSR